MGNRDRLSGIDKELADLRREVGDLQEQVSRLWQKLSRRAPDVVPDGGEQQADQTISVV
jgi:hypothetical protein